jgi:hypothetical protein
VSFISQNCNILLHSLISYWRNIYLTYQFLFNLLLYKIYVKFLTKRSSMNYLFRIKFLLIGVEWISKIFASVKFLHTYAYLICVNVRIIVAGMTNQPTIEVAKYRFTRVSILYGINFQRRLYIYIYRYISIRYVNFRENVRYNAKVVSYVSFNGVLNMHNWYWDHRYHHKLSQYYWRCCTLLNLYYTYL